MSNLFKAFKMDSEKERAGVPITYGANDDGTLPTFVVRRRGPTNQLYSKELQRQAEPFRRQMELNTLDPMVSHAVLMRVFVETILVSWDNVYDEKDTLIPYSKENAIKLFNALPELYDDLLAQSAKLALFKSEEKAEERKN